MLRTADALNEVSAAVEVCCDADCFDDLPRSHGWPRGTGDGRSERR